MELAELKQRLLEVYPQWDAFLRQTKFIDSLEVDPADNDGQNIYYNSRRFAFYLPEAQAVLLARQVLHVQLAHFARRGRRDPALWRRATEAVVNTLLAHDGFQLPEDSERLPPDTEPVAETVYAALAALQPTEEQEPEEKQPDSDPRTSREGKPRRLDDDQKKIAGNRTDSRVRQPGDAGAAEIIPGLSEYLQDSTNVDYDWFPGETIRNGILQSEFRAYPVPRAEVLLDTSYSVDEAMLRSFVRACKALLRDAVFSVGCFDTKFYGFQEIRKPADINNLVFQGGGGTDFNVAVGAFTGDAENQIIFTDGYGELPRQRCDAVWVVYGTSKVHPKGGQVIYVDPFKKVYATRDKRLTFAAESQEWSSI